jgi:hypothetical protein
MTPMTSSLNKHKYDDEEPARWDRSDNGDITDSENDDDNKTTISSPMMSSIS